MYVTLKTDELLYLNSKAPKIPCGNLRDRALRDILTSDNIMTEEDARVLRGMAAKPFGKICKVLFVLKAADGTIRLFRVKSVPSSEPPAGGNARCSCSPDLGMLKS